VTPASLQAAEEAIYDRPPPEARICAISLHRFHIAGSLTDSSATVPSRCSPSNSSPLHPQNSWGRARNESIRSLLKPGSLARSALRTRK
jgi:hypothetical protein